MKKRLQGLFAGILVGVILAGTTVFAGSDIIKKADLYYKNIKLFINGGQVIPKDVNGNIVEPFIMNGSTYLPIRAVSEALGQEVDWDGKTQTVYIGKKDETRPDNYLSKLQYNNYQKSDYQNSLSIINGTITDFMGKTYTNGILFYKYNNGGADVISYPLNSQYSKLTGNIVIPKSFNLVTGSKSNCNGDPATITIYGDENELLYKATEVTSSLPFHFSIDVTGVNQLTIKVASNDWANYIALTDLALYE